VCNLSHIARAGEIVAKTIFCLLHPLDTNALSCRSSLKKAEDEDLDGDGACFGRDCRAANLILAARN
jgi:hypothetical protein